MYEKEKKDYLYTSRIHKSRQREKILRLCEYTDPVYEEKVFFSFRWADFRTINFRTFNFRRLGAFGDSISWFSESRFREKKTRKKKPDSDRFDKRVNRLLKDNQVSRAAMYALFCRKIWRGVQILEQSGQPEISLMISGFSDHFQSQWHQNAERNAARYKDPHVKAMLNFLTKRYTDASECDEILMVSLL